jgi:hypothetical protein
MEKYNLSVSTGVVIYVSPPAMCLAGGRAVCHGEALTGLVWVVAMEEVALSVVLAELCAVIGAQQSYPMEGTLCMWAAMFLSLRVYVEEIRMRTGETDLGGALSAQAYAVPRMVAAQEEGHVGVYDVSLPQARRISADRPAVCA